MNLTNREALQALYPGLGGARQDPVRLEAALLESANAKASESGEASARFFRTNAQALVDMAHALARVWRDGGTVFCMGNGGSSCDAAHFAVEFQHPITAGRPALAAVDLGAEQATVSALANDVGYDQVFARLIGARARRGDGLVGFSTSGESANLLEAFSAARARGVTTFGFAGGTGGRMRAGGLVDHCLVVETSSVHRAQECHVAAYHILWDLVHSILADDRGAREGERRP